MMSYWISRYQYTCVGLIGQDYLQNKDVHTKYSEVVKEMKGLGYVETKKKNYRDTSDRVMSLDRCLQCRVFESVSKRDSDSHHEKTCCCTFERVQCPLCYYHVPSSSIDENMKICYECVITGEWV